MKADSLIEQIRYHQGLDNIEVDANTLAYGRLAADGEGLPQIVCLLASSLLSSFQGGL